MTQATQAVRPRVAARAEPVSDAGQGDAPRSATHDFVAWDSQDVAMFASAHATGRTIWLDGRRTHYQCRGEGPPLILLHGFFYDSELWANNIDALAQRYTVYALDMWGAGFSTRDDLDYGYSLFDRQLVAFMDALNIRRATLVGQSFGGGQTIRFAAAHRERVTAAVLVGSAGMPAPIPLTARFFELPAVGERLLALPTDRVRMHTLRRFWIHEPAFVTPEYFRTVTRHHKIKGTAGAGLHILRSREPFETHLVAELERIAQTDLPVLLVHGREDALVPLSRGVAMHELLTGSRLEVFERAGHATNSEKFERFNELVLSFLQELPRAA